MNTLRGLLAITFLTSQTAFWCLPLYLIELTRLAHSGGREELKCWVDDIWRHKGHRIEVEGPNP